MQGIGIPGFAAGERLLAFPADSCRLRLGKNLPLAVLLNEYREIRPAPISGTGAGREPTAY
jgi:hypothetical protein